MKKVSDLIKILLVFLFMCVLNISANEKNKDTSSHSQAIMENSQEVIKKIKEKKRIILKINNVLYLIGIE